MLCRRSLIQVSFLFLAILCFSSCTEDETQKAVGGDAVLVSGKFLPYGPFTKSEQKLPFALLTYTKNKLGKKNPLVLSIHSTGSNAQSDLQYWVEVAVKNRLMVVSITRSHPYKNINADLKPIYYLMQYVLFWYPADRMKVYILGTSSGCLTVEWLLEKFGRFWKKGVLLSAPEFAGWAGRVKTERLPSLLVIHGDQDKEFRVDQIRANVATLSSRGAHIEFISDPGKDHGYHSKWLETSIEWLKRKK